MGEEKSFFDRLPLLDKNKATKFVIYGLLVAILFGLMMMISRSIDQNAYSWYVLENQENEMSYWDGVYGYNDTFKEEKKLNKLAIGWNGKMSSL